MKNEFADRLKTIELLKEFPVQERMAMTNEFLSKIFSILQILNGLSDRAKENKEDIRFSHDNFDRMVFLLNKYVANIFIVCNVKESSLKKAVNQDKLISSINQMVNDSAKEAKAGG